MASHWIDELRVSAGAEDKLWGHAVDVSEVLEVLWGAPRFFRSQAEDRLRMIGPTSGGRLLTVVIEATDLAGVWDVVTGWQSSKGEGSAWRNAK